MKNKDIKFLLEKADELKDILTMGQQFIPYLEDIVIFVNDVRPIVEELNQSLMDNLNKLPGVSSQLTQVTEATELATNEILSLAEELSGYIGEMQNFTAEMKDRDKQYSEMNVFLMELINELSKIPGTEDQVAKIKDHLDKFYCNDMLNTINYNEFTKLIDSMQEKTQSIMMALQIQDITEQQIAGVNLLVNIIQEKLNSIIGKISIIDDDYEEMHKEGLKKTKVSKLHREVAFDWDTLDEEKKGNGVAQNDIDDLFGQKKDSGEKMDDSDIDAMFEKFNNSND